MSAIQIIAALKKDGFTQHKKNAKGNTKIFSRFHSSAKHIRVVVDSGINSTGGKSTNKVGIKLCYINKSGSWREITTEIFGAPKDIQKNIAAVEAAEKFVKSCKHCKAKKFTAKSGNVVCANACWTTWGGKKKAANTTKKSSQKKSQKKSATTPKKKSATTPKKKSQKKQRTYPANKRTENLSQKKAEKWEANILPGDLVTIQQIIAGKMTQDFTGSVLGIVQATEPLGYVKVHWTANTTGEPEHMLPSSNCYYICKALDYRLKVLSRTVEYTKVT